MVVPKILHHLELVLITKTCFDKFVKLLSYNCINLVAFTELMVGRTNNDILMDPSFINLINAFGKNDYQNYLELLLEDTFF